MSDTASMIFMALALTIGAVVGHSYATHNLDCASAVIQHGEVRCIAFVDRTYKP